MRVIAGSARGRALKAPRGEGRPTGDKVKGAIFSALEALAFKLGYGEQADEEDDRFASARAWPRVLDLYAGSGALGIEALSRGAERADFVESDGAARRVIADNLRATGLEERGTVHALAAERALSTLAGNYDLILADPPYRDGGAEAVLAGVAHSALVGERSVLVWEHAGERRPQPRLGKLHLLRSRRHGAAAISLYAGGLATPGETVGVDAEHSSA